MGHQLQGGALRKRHLAVDPPPCPAVVALHYLNPLTGCLSQPQAKWHRPALQVVGQPPIGLELRLLDHIRGIDARPEPGVHPQPDDPTQIRQMAGEELLERLPVAGLNTLQELIGFRRIRGYVVHGPSLAACLPRSAGIDDTSIFHWGWYGVKKIVTAATLHPRQG